MGAMSQRGWVLFIALCIIWGIPYLLIRVAVEELSPAALVFFRTAPAALLLAPLAWRRGELRGLSGHWPWILVYTMVELAIPWWLLSHAEVRLSSSMAGLIVASVPLIAIVLYRAAGSVEHVDRRRMAGLLVGFAGVAALVGIDLGTRDTLAMAEVGVVALCYAIGPLVISRRLAGVPSLGVIAVSLLITGALYATPALVALPATVSTVTVGAVATLALVCTALAFVLFFALVLEVGPARTTVITYVNPLVAVLLGVVLLSEPFTPGIAVGLPLILLGSVLGTAPSLRRRTEEVTATAAP
jgi:drug/metabolite transporter (DMT)-like permease